MDRNYTLGDRAKRSDPILGDMAKNGLVLSIAATESSGVYTASDVKRGDVVVSAISVDFTGDSLTTESRSDFAIHKDGEIEYVGGGSAPSPVIFTVEKWGTRSDDRRLT